MGESFSRPDTNYVSKFDPLFGFPEGRKEKVMKVTEEELKSAKVPFKNRDYCAHLYIELMACKKREFPLYFWKCGDVRHHLWQCKFSEHLDSVKNLERDKRLRAREERLRSQS